jgi:hypothetical protein
METSSCPDAAGIGLREDAVSCSMRGVAHLMGIGYHHSFAAGSKYEWMSTAQ